MLGMAATGYSSWSSSLPTTESISTIASIPAPSNVQVAVDGSDYKVTWGIPSGNDYNGNSLAQSFEIQGSSTGASGSWTTLGSVSGNTAQYVTPANTSDAYIRVVTVNHNWLSTYTAGSGGSTGSPPITVTQYQLEQVPVTTSSTVTNTPPNYCGIYYSCAVSVFSAISYAGNSLYPGGGATGYDPALTYPGASDGWTYIASWSDYEAYDPGALVYGDVNGLLFQYQGCVPGSGGYCPLPSGIPYFVSGGYTLYQGDYLIGYSDPYEPDCASSNASNNSSYLNSCVYPYDSSYSPTTTTSSTTYVWEEVPVTTTIN
jgi:hypothetical protein